MSGNIRQYRVFQGALIFVAPFVTLCEFALNLPFLGRLIAFPTLVPIRIQ
jgi:hypothetical protein